MMKRFTPYGYGASPRIQLEGSEASSTLSLDPCMDQPGMTAVYHPDTFDFIECAPESLLFGEGSDENPHAVLLEGPIFSPPECGEDEVLVWDGSEFVCQVENPIETKPLPESKVDKEIKEQVKEEVEKNKEKDRKPKSKTQPPQKKDQKEAFKLEWWQWSIIGVGALAVVGLIAQNIKRGDR